MPTKKFMNDLFKKMETGSKPRNKKKKLICHYCGRKIDLKEDRTLDHKLPKSRGGSNAQTNLVVACKPCNTLKSDMTEEEFWSYLEGIIPTANMSPQERIARNRADRLKSAIQRYDGVIPLETVKPRER